MPDLISSIVTVQIYSIQLIDHVGGTILYVYKRIVILVSTTTKIRPRKAGIDDFYTLPYVWQFVVLNIQPYWIWVTFYWGTLSRQSCPCSAFETIPFELKLVWRVHGMRFACVGQVSVASVKSVIPLAGIN